MYGICGNLTEMPFTDFDQDPEILKDTILSFYSNGKVQIQKILIYLHAHLGLLYSYQTTTMSGKSMTLYAFCHHQFRDYFFVMWDVAVLTILPNIRNIQDLQPILEPYINANYWSKTKATWMRCEYLENAAGRYTLSYYYNLPVLEHTSHFEYFIRQYGFHGMKVTRGYGYFHSQIDKGFFLPPRKAYPEWQEITYYNAAEKVLEKKPIAAYQVIYILRDLDNAVSSSHDNRYSWLNKSTKEALFYSGNKSKFYYTSDYTKLTYEELWKGYISLIHKGEKQ